MPRTVKTKFESTQENPGEAQLEARIAEETASQEAALAEEDKHAKGRKEDLDLLIHASGRSERDLQKRVQQHHKWSKAAAEEAKTKHAKPPIDIDAWHEKDIAQAREIAEKSEGRHPNPSWYGFIWRSSYTGSWSNWTGEAEEIPSVTTASGGNRVDPRAQAWGEGWFNSDFSVIHAYLAFELRSPSWGHLEVYAYPWVHGFYSLYSNDTWYNREYARAELDTWVDLHQNYWRGRQYQRWFTMAGDELHPTRSGRIDEQRTHSYSTDVGEGDTVTIRVGARLYCRAKADGAHSTLDCQEGAANYVYVPYVHWYLRH